MKAKLLYASEHMVMCRRSVKGSSMCVAYEYLRLLPEGELTRDLMWYEANDDTTEDEMFTEVRCSDIHDTCSDDDGDDTTVRARHIDDGTDVTMENATDASKETYDMLGTMMTTNDAQDSASKDIGDIVVIGEEIGGEIESNEQREIQEMDTIIGNGQVRRIRLGCCTIMGNAASATRGT